MSALKPFLTNIANAIREKKETTAPINAQDFASEILSIEGGGPKPTLNAPLISVSVLYGKVVVDKSINGEFPKEYLLYINGEQKAVSTENVIPLNDYITSENAQIKVKCRNDEYFNESDFSNTIEYDIAVSGTAGLAYSGNTCTGIGTATATKIYVANVVNGTNISIIGKDSFRVSDKEIYFPDTIRRFEYQALMNCSNTRFYFSDGVQYFVYNNFLGTTSCIFDFSKCTSIPTWEGANGTAVGIIIVPDNLYNDWISATNWSKIATRILKVSDWIAQGGTV